MRRSRDFTVQKGRKITTVRTNGRRLNRLYRVAVGVMFLMNCRGSDDSETREKEREREIAKPLCLQALEECISRPTTVMTTTYIVSEPSALPADVVIRVSKKTIKISIYLWSIISCQYHYTIKKCFE